MNDPFSVKLTLEEVRKIEEENDRQIEEEKHEFDPVMVCAECGELHEDCECDESTPEETEECAVCGMDESDPSHDA
jgi:hypothetical protein